MPDLKDGETFLMKGSAKEPYKLKNTGGIYSCECMAWRNQSQPIEKRTCKHIRKLRGDEAEQERIGGSLVIKGAKTKEKVTAIPPALLLAEKWTPDIDPTGWWLSEKLDGQRSFWNGKEMISRLGNKIYAPEWFTKDFPTDRQLDGELWIKRKAFQETVSIVRRQDMPETWGKISYLVFDQIMKDVPFEDRITSLLAGKATYPTNLVVIPQIKCKGFAHLEEEMARITKLGGEGVMLRQPGSLYEGCRSSTLLKVKKFLDDEAVVTGYEDGKGRHVGRTGAINVEWKGKKFKLGTGLSDRERENPPAIGSRVTFKYQELSTDKIPRFPVYSGPAIDK